MTTEIILLCAAAFGAGFIDAVSGGGGLIQTPAALILLPEYPLATVIGTLKIPAFTGTFFAATQYAKRVSFNYKQLAAIMCVAFAAAFAGSKLLTLVSNHFMKPLLLLVLVAVGIYTFMNRNFGNHTEKTHSLKTEWIWLMLISLVLGFYDGFIGPGSGSFMMLAFISLCGFDFLKASAHAKFITLATNFGSLIFFAVSGKIIYSIAWPMAVCNGAGGLLGARLAILKGNAFIRIFFLVIITITIMRFAYDVFK